MPETDFDKSSSVRRSLQAEFAARCSRNSRYSLRSYARVLGLGFSDLSKILRGERRISEKMYIRLSPHLPPTSVVTPYESIDHDTFSVIADWYHFAILALIRTKNFTPKVESVARRLGISRVEATAALERLERLGFLRRRKTWKVLRPKTSTVSTRTSAALRQLQTQILDRARRALETVEISRRDQASTILPIDSSKLPEAIRRIDAFRHEIAAFLESGNTDSVYCFSSSFFPLTENLKGEAP